jgi:hypothetical protein
MSVKSLEFTVFLLKSDRRVEKSDEKSLPFNRLAQSNMFRNSLELLHGGWNRVHSCRIRAGKKLPALKPGGRCENGIYPRFA